MLIASASMEEGTPYFVLAEFITSQLAGIHTARVLIRGRYFLLIMKLGTVQFQWVGAV